MNRPKSSPVRFAACWALLSAINIAGFLMLNGDLSVFTAAVGVLLPLPLAALIVLVAGRS